MELGVQRRQKPPNPTEVGEAERKRVRKDPRCRRQPNFQQDVPRRPSPNRQPASTKTGNSNNQKKSKKKKKRNDKQRKHERNTT